MQQVSSTSGSIITVSMISALELFNDFCPGAVSMISALELFQ